MAKHPNPEIVTLPSRTFIGMKASMSFADNRTKDLWTAFRSRSGEVSHRVGLGFFSLQYYPDFAAFTPTTVFTKWACVEVSEVEHLPGGMEVLNLSAGLWAQFHYRGTVAQFGAMVTWMYEGWLPDSGYELDDRHHYEYLDHRWLGPFDERSEEEVFVPLKTPDN